ncbi:RNA-guided endonuclease InsQ/TnpB family protein [Streptosporangium sandarakinum]|uniref:RNA-guided endonuclease InsQ/TnpB family protein n=1 Tax=Streptosporangium sandarakinum TaxID=1260955 RepID=UPI00371FE3BC
MARIVKRAYRYRFHPTPGQAAELARTFGCVRYVYDKALDHRTRAYRQEGRRVSYAESSARLTEWKRSGEYGFLSEVSSVPLQQALRHLQAGFANFFARRARYPTFRSRKKAWASAEYTRSAFRRRDGALTPAKTDAPLDIVWSRPLPEGAGPSTVTVSRDAAGRWFVSLLVEEKIRSLPPVEASVGVDAGVTARNHSLARAISDASWRRMRTMLEYKTAWYGRELVVIDRFFPSSRLCSACGVVQSTMPLSVREWECACGATHDRDVNAAANILAAGPAER